MLTAPAGSPSMSASMAKTSAFTSAVCGAALTTAVHPAAMHGASERTSNVIGAFQGTMMPATPMGFPGQHGILVVVHLGDPAEDVPGEPGVVAEFRDAGGHLVRGLADELAVLPCQRPRDVRLAAFQAIGELQQHLCADPRPVRPGGHLERLACGADGRFGVGEPGVGEPAKRFPGARIDALGVGAFSGCNPLSGYPVSSFQCHDVSIKSSSARLTFSTRLLPAWPAQSSPARIGLTAASPPSTAICAPVM